MERHVSMEEISDGKLYGPGDMVRADCGGCEGCSACCKAWGRRWFWIRWTFTGSAWG